MRPRASSALVVPLLALALLAPAWVAQAPGADTPAAAPDIEVFTREGCPFCAAARVFLELLCTSGFPAVYTQILTLRQLPWWEYYAYLGLYNVAYMLDDATVLTIAVVTLGRRKLRERGGRWLKLAGGVVMLGLAAALIARPAWLM